MASCSAPSTKPISAPAGTQADAAKVLGLPFSTYRRHLAAGVVWIVEWLWERELYGDDPAAGEQH